MSWEMSLQGGRGGRIGKLTLNAVATEVMGGHWSWGDLSALSQIEVRESGL